MATEPMLAKLLICGIKKVYYVVNILQSTSLKIQILVLVHYLQNKPCHIGLQVQFHFNCSFEGKFACTISAYGFVRYNPGSKSPAIIRHHVNIPTTLISFFHCPNVLMEPLPLFLANIAKIAWEIV